MLLTTSLAEISKFPFLRISDMPALSASTSKRTALSNQSTNPLIALATIQPTIRIINAPSRTGR